MKKQEEKETMNRYSSLIASATEDELIVAQILLDLPTEIANRRKFDWGKKRRRSAPSSFPPVVRRKMPQVKVPEIGRAGEKLSPDTPLSFTTSEPDDDKCNRSSKKNSKKRSRKEEDSMTTEDLIQRRDSIRGEIEHPRKRLKAQNLYLTADKQKVLNSCQRNEKSQTERFRMMNLGMDLTQSYPISMLSYPQPSIYVDPTAQNFSCSFGPIKDSSKYGLEVVNPVGPIGIPDLNISAEEAFGVVDSYQPLDQNKAFDDRRARCAEARRIRRGIIINNKLMKSACGIQLPKTR